MVPNLSGNVYRNVAFAQLRSGGLQRIYGLVPANSTHHMFSERASYAGEVCGIELGRAGFIWWHSLKWALGAPR